MADLSTNYMGLNLKNPIIVGASNLVLKTENLRKAEKAGAAAIVFKSLFEEQVQLEQMQMQDEMDLYNERHAEMVKLFPSMEHAGPQEYLVNLKEAKKTVSIPVIASLNAIYKETWLEYAKLIEETGVDGLELNFFAVPLDPSQDAAAVEKSQIEILDAVKKAIKIPVSVKLSPFYTNPLQFIHKIDKSSPRAVVLFNRLFQPDIDIEEETHISPWNLSVDTDNRLPLRFAGLLYKQIEADICASTGIMSGDDVIKMILAGATSVQVVSTLYQNKIEVIGKMISDLENWMNQKGYKSLNDFRGKLSKSSLKDPFIYKRAQYVDLLLKSDSLLKNYPV